MWRVWGGDRCARDVGGNQSKIGQWTDPDVDGKMIIIWIFRKLEGVVGSGWSWLRIGTGGGHL
jgi:hypothetical protein